MHPRHLAFVSIPLGFAVGACGLVWSYDDFKDHATGGSATASASTSGRSSSSGGGAPASSSQSATVGASVSSSSATTGSSAGSSTASSGSSSSGGCTTSGPDGGACTDPCDVAAMKANQCSVQNDIVSCGNNATCLEGHGFSPACAACLGQVYSCGWGGLCASCLADANSALCNQCLTNHNCDAAFTACSGVTRPEHASDYDASCP